EHAEAKKLLKKAISFEDELKKKLGTTEPVPRSTADRMALTEGFVNMGQRYMQGGNFKDAKISFGRAMALIVLDAKLEKFKVIVDQQMEKINSVDNQAQLWDKGRELYKSNEYEECLKTLSQLPEDYLPAPDLLSILAFCHWKTGDSDKAKSLAQRQIVKQPNNNRAKFILGNIYASEGNNSAAYTILNEVKEADPDYPGIDDILYKVSAFKWGPLAIPLVVVGLLVWIAYIIHQKLPEFRKNSAINQARSLLNKNYPKDCIEKLAEVKKLPNISAFDGALISRLLAQAYLKTATYDRAIGECKHLISINPQDSEAQKWLGFSYLGRRAMTPESLPVLLNLYKSEKNNVALLGLLGQHYISQKVLAPEGVDILEKWLESEPNNPDVIKGLGKFYLQKGRSDPPAMKVFEMMMELKQQDPEVLLGIAKVQMRLNNQQSCLQICEKVLSLDVNNELVHSVLRESYQKVGKIPDLLEIYRAFLGENPYNVAFQRGFAAASKLAEKEQISSASKSPSEVNRPQSEVPPQVSEATVSSPAEPAEGQTICPHCSKPNSQADYYCQHCGKSVI
ncbi:hypothetical protein HYY75_08435, partial [bacterium]|nr:hypothetical protein [bacterium]